MLNFQDITFQELYKRNVGGTALLAGVSSLIGNGTENNKTFLVSLVQNEEKKLLAGSYECRMRITQNDCRLIVKMKKVLFII